MGHQCNSSLAIVLVAMLVLSGILVEGKRTFGKSRSSSSSSSSSSSRRITSNHGSVTKPSYTGSAGNSHADLAKLSYSNYNSQPNRASVASAPKTSASAPGAGAAPPIGWNVPNKPQGPPPAYSPTNPIGGGHSNLHDAPPAYKPSNVGPPSYSAATHTGNTFGAGQGAAQHHTPIQATNMQSVHSSYPKQEYHPGAMPSNYAPNMQSYHPSYAGAPIPVATLPHGGYALPPGAVLLPAGSAFPANAMHISQPQQSSSGPGFGTGLLTGALSGGLLGYALAPSGSRDVVHQQAPPAASNGEKVIIINNGPPGSVTTSDGTTVINTGAATPMVQGVPPAPAPAPVAGPDAASMPVAAGAAAAATLAGAGSVAANLNGSEATPAVAPSVVPPAPGVAPEPGTNNAAPGGIYCIPVMVNVTSPTDPSKMVEEQQIACFNAPSPPASDGLSSTVSPPAAAGAEAGKLENHNQMSGVNAELPTQRTSTAMLPENSKIQQAAAGTQSISIVTFITSTILSMLLAYCMH